MKIENFAEFDALNLALVLAKRGLDQMIQEENDGTVFPASSEDVAAAIELLQDNLIGSIASNPEFVEMVLANG